MGGFRSQTPIHERIGELQREKNDNIQRLRVKNEQAQKDLTFQPRVNEKSKKIVQLKEEGGYRGMGQRHNSAAYINNHAPGLSAAERLYRDATDRLEKNFFQSIQETGNKGQYFDNNHAATFHPAISHSSKWISENSNMFNGNLKDFHARQAAFLQKQQENREQNAALIGEQSKCTFKPQINLTSEIICESDQKGETKTIKKE